MKSVNELEKILKEQNEERRETERELRKARKKQDNLRYYVLGKIVVDAFPELAEITPANTKAENAERFGWFEEFLRDVLKDLMWEEQYKNRIPRNKTN